MNKKIYITGKRSFLNGIISLVITLLFGMIMLLGDSYKIVLLSICGYGIAYLGFICFTLFEINAFVRYILKHKSDQE